MSEVSMVESNLQNLGHLSGGAPRVPPVVAGGPAGPVAPIGGPELVPAMESAVATAPDPEPLHGEVPERDRIVVLGRRQSGKTIYLASIYAKLWQSLDGITAKALSGEVHKQLMNVHQMLKDGQWPPSTLGTSQIDLELDYHGKQRLLVALDFAGELFSKAFLDEQSDWPGVKELVNHIDRAAAVLLLVDPSVVAGMDKQAAMEDDFGLVQAVQRIRNWPGGDTVPIVLVLTKMDQHQNLLDTFGGPLEFVRRHFPALLRVLKQIPIIQVSAVQTEEDRAGRPRPRPDSTPINVDAPLRYCLRELDARDFRQERQRAEDDRRMAESRRAQDIRLKRGRAQRRARLIMTAISIAGGVLITAVLYFNL